MRTQATSTNNTTPAKHTSMRGVLVASAIVATLAIGGAGTAYAAGSDAAPGESTSPTPIEQIARGCQRMWGSTCLWMSGRCNRTADQPGSGRSSMMGGRAAIGARAGAGSNAETPGTTTVRPGAGTGYVDADGNGVCDHAQVHDMTSDSGYVDADDDGVCDYAEADGWQTSTHASRGANAGNANGAGPGRGYMAGSSGRAMGRAAL